VAAAAIDGPPQGIVGHLASSYPGPRRAYQELAERRAFVVPELNMGQMVLEVERAVAGRAAVISVPHAGGTVHEPETILARIMEAAQ
jgi:2-oxoglutarate ferredoxin oxidoreductase subunit alpha